MNTHGTRGFTLIEIMIVAAIILVLLGMAIPFTGSYFIRRAMEAEDRVQAALLRDIEGSFLEESMALNISAVTGQINPTAGDMPTVFSTSTAPVYNAITGQEWFCRIAKLKGYAVLPGAAVSRTSQPALYDLAFTESGQPRLLFLGPTNEPAFQRYLLVALISPNGELALPPYQATTQWFDAIWNTPWDRADVSIPSLWTTLLTPQQVAVWQAGGGGKTHTPRLRVTKIVQRKFTVYVNSNHATDYVWVNWNNGAAQPSTYPFPPLSPTAFPVGPILHGRVLYLRTGETYAAAKESRLRVFNYDNFISQ